MSRIEGTIRLAGAALASVIVAYVVTAAPIIPSEQTWPPIALPLFRFAFGVLLWFRLHRLRRWPLMLWPGPHRLPGGRIVTVGHVLTVWQVLALTLAVGLATPLSAALCFACELYVFSRTFTRSLEDVLFQSVLFFLIFAGAGAAGSIDARLGIAHLDRFDHLLARNLWWLAVALIMFSAGFEKLFSPLWRRGLGFNYFVGLPHLVQRPFTFLRRFERFGHVLSWVTVIAELALLPAAFLPIGRVAVTVVLVGFAVSLFLVVDLSFIGQVTMLVLVLFGVGDAVRVLELAPGGEHAQLVAPSSPLLFGLMAVAVIVVLAVTDAPVGRARAFCQAISRFTIGVTPNRVFTEVQLYGIYIYRVVGFCTDGSERALVQTFQADGSQGPLQRWQPRVFLKFTYEVTDYCLRYLRDGEAAAQRSVQYAAVRALLQAAHVELKSAGLEAGKVVLSVRAVEADEAATAHAGRFTMSDWVGLLECTVTNGELGAPVHVSEPPPVHKTRRVIA